MVIVTNVSFTESPNLLAVGQVSRGQEYLWLLELGAFLWASSVVVWHCAELVARAVRASLPGWKVLHLIPDGAAALGTCEGGPGRGSGSQGSWVPFPSLQLTHSKA